MERRKLLAMSATGACVAALVSGARGAGMPASLLPDGACSVHEFGAKGDGRADDTASLQRAIDHVRERAVLLGDTSALPCVVLPAGHYRLTGTISTSPWVKLRTVGSVVLDFTQLPLDRDGIVCRNETSVSGGILRFPGNRSPFLDGTGGTISILGPGWDRSNGWGVVVGNENPDEPDAVRDAGGCHVVVTGWRGALRIDPVHTYLNAWRSCRFEQNRDAAIRVSARPSGSVDSGERMSFYDCTFAGSQRAVSIDAAGQDFVFDACSFDFNGDAIHFGPQACYGTVALSHCHIEGIDGQLVDASEAGERLRVALNHSIVLARPWKRKALANAPRRLVSGRVRFSAIGVEFRFEQSAEGLDTLIGDEVHIESLSALSFPGKDALPASLVCLNADATFTTDAHGTSSDALIHWKADAQHIEHAFVHHTKSAHALFVTAPSLGRAAFALATRSTFAVEPGHAITASCVVAANGTKPRVVLQIEFLTIDGRRLWAASSGENDTLPSLRAAVPPGTSCARLHAGFSDWSGDLQVLRLAVWRAA